MPPPPAWGATLPFTWLWSSVSTVSPPEPKIVAGGDAAADASLGGVAVHLDVVELRRAVDVRDPATAEATVLVLRRRLGLVVVAHRAMAHA